VDHGEIADVLQHRLQVKGHSRAGCQGRARHFAHPVGGLGQAAQGAFDLLRRRDCEVGGPGRSELFGLQDRDLQEVLELVRHGSGESRRQVPGLLVGECPLEVGKACTLGLELAQHEPRCDEEEEPGQTDEGDALVELEAFEVEHRRREAGGDPSRKQNVEQAAADVERGQEARSEGGVSQLPKVPLAGEHPGHPTPRAAASRRGSD